MPSLGYDGQFYYRFARDPFNWNPTAYGITVDHNYRYTRIGYSLIAWIISLGGHARLLPAVLVVINLVCVALMAYLGAKLAQESGRHALWGLAFVVYMGLAISVGRDTSEPLADACMLAGILAYRHSRYIWAAVLITPAGTAAGAAEDAAVKAHATLMDTIFSLDRVMTNKRLGWLMVIPVIVAARRHILHQ